MTKKFTPQQIKNIKRTMEINLEVYLARKIMDGSNIGGEHQSFFTRSEMLDAYKEGFACGLEALMLNQ
jgi:hypothetical protein